MYTAHWGLINHCKTSNNQCKYYSVCYCERNFT